MMHVTGTLGSSITGKTNVVGLIGWPVSHSVSPPMHNAAFAALNLNWCYIPLPVGVEPMSRVGEAIAGLRSLGLRGANVTVPHKQAVMPYLDELSPAAAAIGAVNTIIVRDDGTFLGDNTDARGFIADLRDQGVDPVGRSALVLGAGGSARAVAYGLAEAGVSNLVIVNRTVHKAAELCSLIAGEFPTCRLRADSLPQGLTPRVVNADLIVNTTSLGMVPAVQDSPWPDAISMTRAQVVYDLVYNPPVTRLLRQASSGGARAINGLGMLVWQGAIAFEAWTGITPPADVMRHAALTHLRGRPN